MAKNINCKKVWHPSRHEVQNKIKRYKMDLEESRKITPEERTRILTAEDSDDVEYCCLEGN
ncbi:hypothetical protein ENBRE01_1400 [Enteropsectra breve]|nr:hypothetical protein ENBRE01_1014 [Enteropsectra breve]KAI5150283.1 hypothetical protein ENBRE01_1400 [Enteropsectra breve]